MWKNVKGPCLPLELGAVGLGWALPWDREVDGGWPGCGQDQWCLGPGWGRGSDPSDHIYQCQSSRGASHGTRTHCSGLIAVVMAQPGTKSLQDMLGRWDWGLGRPTLGSVCLLQTTCSCGERASQILRALQCVALVVHVSDCLLGRSTLLIIRNTKD
jgi:hypothetical protein